MRGKDEARLEKVVTGSLRSWLARVREAVMAPWRKNKMPPDPHAVFSLVPAWREEVSMILTTIGQIGMSAWSRATDVPPVSRHSFVMSSLAHAENLMVAIPDEVYHLIFAEIADGTNAGESVEKIAARVDGVLSWSGSPNWPNRARVIAITETTRAYGAATIAAGMEQARVTGRRLRKRWLSEGDQRVRAEHRLANNQTVPLEEPFMVGGFPMMAPGDPLAPADEVCGCRCDVEIVNERQNNG